jgi:hypothetical protein
MRGLNEPLAFPQTEPGLASSGRRESFGARLSDEFRQHKNSRVPHLPQSLNQRKGFAGSNFGEQQALAFQNKIRMR